MKTGIMGSLIAVVLLVAAPVDAAAQAPVTGDSWWDWVLPDVVTDGRVVARDGRVIPLPRDRRAGPGRGGSPAFCRSGAGHPVFGRQWCIQKGFALAGRLPRWEQRRWEDIVLGSPRRTSRRGELDRGTLIDILGDVVLGRFDGQRRDVGADAPLTGRWLQEEGSSVRVLQLRAGDVPIAELSDLTGDGRVDAVLVNSSP